MKMGNKSFRSVGFWALVLLALAVGILLAAASTQSQIPAGKAAAAKTPCQITSINAQTGIVSAKVDATGQAFQFKASDPTLVRSLKVGQQVYVDLQKRQVSLDGRVECCAITSISAPPTAGAASANAKPGATSGQPSASPLAPGGKPGQIAFLAPRLATAEQANVSVLATAEHNEWALKRLNAVVEGKPIQVDYFHLHGIEGIQKAEGLPPSVREVLLAHASQLKPCVPSPKPAAGANQQVPVAMSAQADCEDIPFYVVNKQMAEEWARTHPPLSKTSAPSPRASTDSPKRNLAAASPSGGGKFLRTAYSRPGNGEVQPQLPSAKDLEKKTQQAAGDAAKDVSKDAQHAGEQLSDLGKRAQGLSGKWAKHWQQEAKKDWEKAEDCWADHSASHKQNFHIHPGLGFDVDLASMPGPLPNIGQGTLKFQLPIDLKFQAEASVFYIPCAAVMDVATPLPFVVRPRDVAVGEPGANGEPVADKGYISYGASVDANIQYIGYPGGGPITISPESLHMPPTIPILPPTVIMAGPVPIEFSIYLYLRGRINIGGEAAIESNYSASSTKEGPFWFVCDGKGCRGDFSKIQGETTVFSGPGLAPKKGGRLFVEPAFWAALQLDLYNGILMARGGPEPAISADVWGFEGSGCGTSGTAAPSGLGGDSVKALTADIDANLYTPWEVRLLGTTDPYTGDYMTGRAASQNGGRGWPGILSPSGKPLLWQKHLYFNDLPGSSAIGPLVSSSGSPSVGHPTAYRVKMRPCYPYKDEVEYALKWGGGQGGNSNSGSSAPTAIGVGMRGIGSVVNNGDTSVWGSPQRDLVVNHTWTQPGQFTLQVIPLRDKHGRTFDSSAATQLTVNVPGAQASSAKH